jgi:hypothetical protein
VRSKDCARNAWNRYTTKIEVFNGKNFSQKWGRITKMILDLVKTRLQLGKQYYSGLGDVFQKTYSKEGIRGFYKGIIPPIIAETPKRATKFFTFEQYKVMFVSDRIPLWAVSLFNTIFL